MIKAGGQSSIQMMHKLCNKIYETKECPKDWGKATIVPIHKKGDKKECSNYRAISLLSIAGKVYTKILQMRLKRYVEEEMSEEQAGFRKGRGTMDQIFTLRQMSEKYIEHNRTLYNNFIDFKQAFDSVWQEGLWKTMRHCGIPEELVLLIEDLYDKSESAVRINGELTEWFKIKVGVRQGCGMSSDLFNLLLEIVMRLAKQKEKEETGININGRIIDNLRFADDIDLMANTHKKLQELTNRVDDSSRRMGLKINVEKTKTMIIGKHHEDIEVKRENRVLEQVTKFVYLGGTLTEDGGCTEDIKRRCGLACAAFGGLNKMWKAKNISIKTKMKIYHALVEPLLLYGSETWCLKKEDERRLLAAEMNWLRRIRGRSCCCRREKIRNEVTRRELGVTETIIEQIRKRRLSWFGHVKRMDEKRIANAALHGHVEGERSRGRQQKTWMDNIREDLKK